MPSAGEPEGLRLASHAAFRSRKKLRCCGSGGAGHPATTNLPIHYIPLEKDLWSTVPLLRTSFRALPYSSSTFSA